MRSVGQAATLRFSTYVASLTLLAVFLTRLSVAAIISGFNGLLCSLREVEFGKQLSLFCAFDKRQLCVVDYERRQIENGDTWPQ